MWAFFEGEFIEITEMQISPKSVRSLAVNGAEVQIAWCIASYFIELRGF